MILASNHFGNFVPSYFPLPKLRKTEARGEQPRIVCDTLPMRLLPLIFALRTLTLNAGVMLHARALPEDGLEMTLASNRFGNFLLSYLLLPKLPETNARGERPRTV